MLLQNFNKKIILLFMNKLNYVMLLVNYIIFLENIINL